MYADFTIVNKERRDICEESRERSIAHREWVCDALQKVHADRINFTEPDLVELDLPFKYTKIYLKDESAFPSGSLKHRLAKSLFLWGLSSGRIGPQTTIVECSSGSTAISEAYFARMLGLNFIAIIPDTTASAKIRQIESYGGQCRLVPAARIVSEAEVLARKPDHHFMDQFTYAEQATDWRSEDNIAAAIFRQMENRPCPIPKWIVVGAGTGGTSTTIGRYLSYVRPQAMTKLCVVDPDNSVLFDFYKTGDHQLVTEIGSRIEGIGRPRVEPSFFAELVDRMLKIPDEASIAAIHYLEALTGQRYGASTGTNFVGAVKLARELEQAGQPQSIVSLICDRGERYADTYYNKDWVRRQGLNIEGAFQI